MNRRNFLKAGIVGSSLPLLAQFDSAAIASTFTGWAGMQPHWVISDQRFEPSRRYGAQAVSSGARHLPIDGDVTALWEKLNREWRTTPAVIAGMTARQPLFCIEQLAHDHGMRVVLRVEHDPSQGGSVRHLIQAPTAQMESLAELISNPQDWSGRLARLSTSCSWSRGQGPCIEREIQTPQTAPPLDVPLVSWVIAPAFA